jgi:hypothetical protein
VAIAGAAAYFRAFEGVILGPAEALENWCISGFGGSGERSEPRSLRLSPSGGSQDDRLQIEILRGRPFPMPMGMGLHSLIFQSVTREFRRGPVHFPVEFRIEKERARLCVDGRPRAFDLYVCGATAVATAHIGVTEVRVLGDREGVQAMSLRGLTEKELDRLIRRHRAHRAELEKLRPPRRRPKGP